MKKDKDIVEYVDKMRSSFKDKIPIELFDSNSFIDRYNYFKQDIEKNLPMFTKEEIIKIHKHLYEFKKLYGWSGVEYLFHLLDFENKLDKKIKQ